MARKDKYKPKQFESARPGKDTSANIYSSMLLSESFQSLTTKQQILYVCLKDQYYGKRKPRDDYPNEPTFARDDQFYFSWLDAKRYGIYKSDNSKRFYLDMKRLEEKGFIKKLMSGRNKKTRSIYQFVDGWQGTL